MSSYTDSITPSNDGQTPHDNPQFITAWIAAQQYSEDIGRTLLVRLKNGRTLYSDIAIRPGKRNWSIRLERYDELSFSQFPRITTRYVKPDTLVELVPIDAQQTGGAS